MSSEKNNTAKPSSLVTNKATAPPPQRAPLREDEAEHERQKEFLRLFKQGIHELNGATNEVRKCMDALMSALAKVQKSLNVFVSSMKPVHPEMTKVVRNFYEVHTSLTQKSDPGKPLKATLPTFHGYMQEECQGPLERLERDVDEMLKLKAQRRMFVETYEADQKDVDEKRRKYEKEGKSLSESKTYGEKVAKLKSSRGNYEEAVTEFQRRVCHLEKTGGEVIFSGSRRLFEHTSGFLGVLHDGIFRLFQSTARMPLSPYVPPPMLSDDPARNRPPQLVAVRDPTPPRTPSPRRSALLRAQSSGVRMPNSPPSTSRLGWEPAPAVGPGPDAPDHLYTPRANIMRRADTVN